MTSGGLGLSSGLSQDINLEELDFSDLFLYNTPGEDFPAGCDKDDPGVAPQNDTQPPLLVVDTAYICTSSQPSSAQSPSPESPTGENPTTRPPTIPAPSPRIEITPSGPSLSAHTLEPGPGSKSYRECVSPASSNSSTGWSVDIYSPLASPYVSPSNGDGCSAELSTLDLCPVLQSIQTSSPGNSPQNSVVDDTYLLPRHQRAASPHPHQRSRSASPQGKRSYEPGLGCQGGTPVKQRSRSPSPIPSPRQQQQQQGSYYLQQYQASGPDLEGVLSSLTSGLPRVTTSAAGAHGPLQRQDCVYGEGYNWAPEQERVSRTGAEVKSEPCYMIPAVWAPAVHHAVLSGVSLAPLPLLDWPLPSESGQYELLIQKQPRSHHRAQYETEGSRGAIKTPNGGHPEVQLRGYQGSAPVGLQVFIGTADERILKPHSFYQINRITGKTVTTPSLERMLNGTKVLEIPLEPNNGMSVVIDCVGILKLRNADIELRNGETDIGRKNTRVRLVFRVHIPQPGGQLVSLQVASHPIECSQRSAQELPAVERQSLDSCSVLGGQQMVLTGQNFTSDSRVIFSEKTQDGKQIWEVEATVDRDKTQANMLFVEVPPYQKHTICNPAKVNFYVVNGKKKCSQPQHFTYTPITAIKVEPLGDFHLNSYGYSDFHSLSALSMKSLYHPLDQEGNLHTLGVSPTVYHYAGDDLRGHVLPSDPLTDQPLYYQSRSGALIASPVPCHPTGQHYNATTSAALLAASLTCPQPAAVAAAASTVQCVSARTPAVPHSDGPLVADAFEACLLTRNYVQAPAPPPLGRSPPPPGYTQGPGHPQGKGPGAAGAGAGSGRGGQDAQAPERVTVKQENLSCAYLEDVNDIIRRDLKGQSSDPGGLHQQPWPLTHSQSKQ